MITDDIPECKYCESTSKVLIFADFDAFGNNIYYYLCSKHSSNLGPATKLQYDEMEKVARKYCE